MQTKIFFVSIERKLNLESKNSFFNDLCVDAIFQYYFDNSHDYKKQRNLKLKSLFETIKKEILKNHIIFILDIDFYDVYFDFVEKINQFNVDFNFMWVIHLKNFNQQKLKTIPEHNGDLNGYFWGLLNPNIHFHCKRLFSQDHLGQRIKQQCHTMPKHLCFKETFYFHPQNDIQDVYNCFLLHVGNSIKSDQKCPIFIFLNGFHSENLYQSFIEMIKPVENYPYDFHVHSSLFGSSNLCLPLSKLIPKLNQLVCFMKYKNNIISQTKELILNQIKNNQKQIHLVCMDDVFYIIESMIHCFNQLIDTIKSDKFPTIYVYWMDGSSVWVDYFKTLIKNKNAFFNHVKWIRCENQSFDSTFQKKDQHMKPLIQILKFFKKQEQLSNQNIPSISHWDFLLKQSFFKGESIHFTTTKEFLILQYDGIIWKEKAILISNPLMNLKYIPIDTRKLNALQ